MKTNLVLPTALEARNYQPGMRIVCKPRLRWWVRLWCWLTRRKPVPVATVTRVDHTLGVITLDTELK